VRDRAGEQVGVVDDVRFESGSGHLQGMVVRAGGSIQKFLGGGRTIEVTRSQIDHVDDDGVYLRVDRDEMERTAR
jgi:sporulation protein YlmC with PRC-barrel domain